MSEALLTPEVQAIAQRSVLCWLATCDAQGYPSVSPKEIWSIVDADHLVVADIASPGSRRNVAHQPMVCVSFVDILVQKGFKIKGMATYLRPGEAGCERWAEPLVQMAGERFRLSGVLVVKARLVEPVLAPSYLFYPASTTEEAQVRSALQTYARCSGGRMAAPD